MKRRRNSDSIPIDLIPDILSRLPEKSIARFQCVSKLWRSLLLKPYFTELFMTRSSSRPRLLIGVKQDSEWFLFSSPQPQNPSSLVVSADFHKKMSFDSIYNDDCSYASGMLYFPNIRTSYEDGDAMHAICNPSTGQYAILPEPRGTNRGGRGFLGFDPIGKQFKGKLGLINREQDYGGGFPLKLHMWVLEDIDKREFSAYVYTLKIDDDKVVKDSDYISVAGATASGEIVLVKKYNACEPFYVLYFNPARNTLRSVEIQGVRQDGVEWSNDHHEVHVFVDHGEDLKFDVMKAIYAASSIN
ncbi:putative F-box protein At1g30920 [Capsella rubella]|uniref:putative F-box protein At1g30920 n=1 Tax=Capsella rubella TaxID=81985 RepID=UPI000CD4CE83|nr:putative F-box protein At1g30920 [Capsella rubella]